LAIESSPPQAEQIQTVTKQNPLVGFTLLSQLVGRHGSHNFDRLTKTKTVEGIMANLSGDAVGEYVAYLKGLFYQNEEGERWVGTLVGLDLLGDRPPSC
jgi:DNA polymerase phi